MDPQIFFIILLFLANMPIILFSAWLLFRDLKTLFNSLGCFLVLLGYCLTARLRFWLNLNGEPIEDNSAAILFVGFILINGGIIFAEHYWLYPSFSEWLATR